ncbi:uncharacterized protein TNCV_1364351 [Trichonephila clavipes]|uniref:Transposase n=1 Tax=Trichonephila clavipes TaxID=2585209 RepID=A0A8X6RYB2_TRICX|nr:uncharacterized protein TNCV_1364351 [Trichonephila clavipes]
MVIDGAECVVISKNCLRKRGETVKFNRKNEQSTYYNTRIREINVKVKDLVLGKQTTVSVDQVRIYHQRERDQGVIKSEGSGNSRPRVAHCQVIYSQFGLAIHQNDHQARRRFVEWAQNEIAIVPDFHKHILFSDEAHFSLNGYVNKQNCHIWSEANPQVYVETPLHPEKLTVWCALWAGGILLQKR